MTSVVTLMASALDRELRSRGLRLPAADCEQILRLVIAGPAAIGQALESSRSAMPPAEPPGGGCIGGDASAVDFSSSATPAPRTPDGGCARSGDAPAVTPIITPAQMAYALLWREMQVTDRPFAREARKLLLASLTIAEQRAAIAWVLDAHGAPADREVLDEADMNAFIVRWLAPEGVGTP